MGRQENIEIFKDTEKLCKENTAIKEAFRKSSLQIKSQG